jgi:hypothetical protein
MNGTVAIRAQDTEQAQTTELVLSRSSYSGPAIRISTNRRFLSRALHLGFSEIGISGVEAPVVCRERDRTYAWQPLSGDAVIEPSSDMIRVESPHASGEATQERNHSVTPRRTMSNTVPRNGQTSGELSNEDSRPVNDSPGSSLSALIQDAEALHRTLSEVQTGARRLIVGLRRHRKQSRLLGDTLRSLRQLKLTENVE